MRRGLNNVALVSVTNSSGKGTEKMVPGLTRLVWQSVVNSKRFLLQELTEVNPSIKRAKDEQSLKQDVIDAFKQTPTMDTAVPLAARVGVPFLLTVTIQDYKEIAPEPVAMPTPEANKLEPTSGSTPAASSQPTGASESKPADKGKQPAAKKKKKQPTGPGVEITLLAQMFCVGGEGGAPMEVFKSIVMVGTARARDVSLAPDTSGLESEAMAQAVKNIVLELVRAPKRRK